MSPETNPHKPVKILWFLICCAICLSKVSAVELDTLSRKIDELVESHLKDRGIYLSAPCDDSVFLRRASLSLMGRIPTFNEVDEFLSSKAHDKRSTAIRRMIHSQGYVHDQFNFWADLLRLQNDRNAIQGITNNEYGDWLMASIIDNKPYDQFVRELVTASGHAADNGAVGFFMRDNPQILDTVATLSQVFLASQIFCAQCHDHPFEDITQKQYYQFAAHLGEVEVRQKNFKLRNRILDDDSNGKASPQNMKMIENLASLELPEQGKQMLVKMYRSMNMMVIDNPKHSLRLPKNYQYNNGKPNEAVVPALLDGKKIKVSAGQTTREAFAEWLTAPDNTQFNRTICNRLWKKMMGHGLYEPVDDFNNDTVVRHQTLLDMLCKTLVDLRYDLKRFQEVLYNTRTFQRQLVRAGSAVDPNMAWLHSNYPAMMNASQLWDSALALISEHPDAWTGRLTNVNQPSLAEIRSLLSSDQIDKEDVMKLLGRFVDKPRMKNIASGEKGPSKGEFLIRSSEVPVSEKNVNVFMDVFGRSDRERIGQLEPSPNLQQSLTMMNGKLPDLLARNFKVLMQNTIAGKTHLDQVNRVYLSILSRPPRQIEIKTWSDRHLTDSSQARRDLIWTLVNSKEFLFIQ